MNHDAPGLAIVAPSGFARDEIAVELALAALRAAGHVVHDYHAASDRRQRFADTEAGRVAQLHAAARDPDIDVVIALRGGYGMSRLMDEIDFSLLAESGKLFVGHSDFTALHMGLLATTGAGSFAGPMICSDFTRAPASAFTMDHFWRCLRGPRHVVHGTAIEGDVNPVCLAEGVLWGGNLAMVNSLVGTPWMPVIDGGILFLEDVGEHPYRIERLLLQLSQSGRLARQSAIVLGDFSGYRLGEFENGYDFAAMLAYLRSVLPVPVLTGLPFGHVPDKTTLAVGASARLESTVTGFSLAMSGYRHLASR
jgi:muramoyltetrapeptide carboxypeptidase